MPNRRTVLASLLLPCLAVAAGAALADEAKPEDFVNEVYRAAGAKKDTSIFADAASRRRYLSKSLQAAVTAMNKRTLKGDAPDLDFDPISNGNDPSVIDLKVKTESVSATEAFVVANFRSHQDKDRSVLRYHLVQENGWKIDNITNSGKDAWDARKIIEGKGT